MILQGIKNDFEINELLKNNQRLILELKLEQSRYKNKYVYHLIRLLPNHYVTVVGDSRIITIESGTNSEELLKLKYQILNFIDIYIRLRKNVFNEFITQNKIIWQNGKISNIRNKLLKNGNWPRGNFDNWEFWAHGSDIEFINLISGQHLNIFLGNYEHLTSWSLLKFIKAQTTNINLINLTEKDMRKILDLLIIESELNETKFFCNKIITRKKPRDNKRL